VCRASLNGTNACRRCRADLSKVQEIERRGQALVGAAMLSMAKGDAASAAEWLNRARAVHAAPAARILRALLASGAVGDTVRRDDAQFPGGSRRSASNGAKSHAVWTKRTNEGGDVSDR
jgi:hypothetical protein